MYSRGEYQYFIKDFEEQVRIQRKILKKRWGIALLSVLSLNLIFLAIFPNQFNRPSTAWIQPVYGGLALLVVLIGYLISLKYVSEKPFFNSLFKDVYQRIIQDYDIFVTYRSYRKDLKSLLEPGGLFTKYATTRVKRQVSGKTSQDHSFHILDATLTTSDGKNQITHFDGIYWVLKRKNQTVVQIRSTGSPKIKGVKYQKKQVKDNLKIYKLKDDGLNDMDANYLKWIEEQRKNSNVKKVYLSVIESEIHFAIWYRKHPARKSKKLNVDQLNLYEQHFLDELEMIEKLDQIEE